jgi:hypothetical protein
MALEVAFCMSVRITRKVPGSVVIRSTGLLDMLYKPSELSEQLGLPLRTIRTWAKLGMPHHRDSQNHLWINGTNFARWLQSFRTQRPRVKLAEDEAFCLRCRSRVKLLQPVVSYRTRPPRLSGLCPLCGGKVNRGVKRDPSA